MEELKDIVNDYESKLLDYIKRKIRNKIIECKANNYDSVKTYIEIRKVTNSIEEDLKEITGQSFINENIYEKICDYTDEYMNDAIAEFERRAKELLSLRTLDELIEEVEKIKAIIRELKEVGSESISEGVVFSKNENCGIICLKKEGV